VSDAYEDNYDKALLISGDSDLLPPVKRVLQVAPHKEVVILAPPGQHFNEAKEMARSDAHRRHLHFMSIRHKHILRAQMDMQGDMQGNMQAGA